MAFWSAVTAVLALAFPAGPDKDENPLGAKVVTASASFNRVPSTLREVIRDAKIGEKVTVTAVQGSFARVTLADGGSGYISRSALTPAEKYQPAPANEKEMMAMKAQGYEAGRFDPETEAEYKKLKGPAMNSAYELVNELEKRLAFKNTRADLARMLEEFRRDGKLGEFAAVK